MRLALAPLLLALWAGASRGAALDVPSTTAPFVREVWQTEQGLPQNSVYAITQTKDGYLWAGTSEGLVRFDGVRFTVFDHQNTRALPRVDISALLAAPDGSLWIGTLGGGLVHLRDGVFSVLGKDAGLVDLRVKTLALDREGTVWVGTLEGGLARLVGDRFEVLTTKDGLPSDRLRALLAARDGALWIGTDGGGLAVLRQGKVRSFGKADGLSSLNVISLEEGLDGSLWAGMDEGIVDRLKDGSFTHLTKAEGLSDASVYAILAGPDGEVFFGSYWGGISELVDGRLRLLGDPASTPPPQGSLPTSSVRCLFRDREGSLWAGLHPGGLHRLRRAAFSVLGAPEGLSRDSVRAILEDRRGDLWVGTEGGGLNRVKDGRIKTWRVADGLPDDGIYALAEDDRGMWVGALRGPPVRIENDRVVPQDWGGGPPLQGVHTLLFDRGGNLWAGTFRDGLVKRAPDGTVTRLTRKDGLQSDRVLILAEGPDGSLWIGTGGGGLNRLKDGKLTVITTKDGLPHDYVYALGAEADGTLWIGTGGGGLVRRLADGTLQTLKSQQGLFDELLYTVLDDGHGSFWFVCNKGIFRVPRLEIEQVMAGVSSRVTSEVFGAMDGLRSPEGNSSGNAGFVGRDGRLAFATLRGVALIDPGAIPRNPLPPPVAIEQIAVDGVITPVQVPGTSAGVRAPLRFPPGRERLEVQYTALSLLVPSRVRFRYRLEPLDPGWIDAGDRRAAFYTRLAPGTYTFRVTAANNDGVWNESGTSVTFTLEPLVYQTRWFQALVVLATLVLGAALYQARIRRLGQRERELEQEVAERTARVLAEKERAERALSEAEASRREADSLRERAEAASRAKSAFLASMSHELRTPLNAVLGFAQLMERRGQRDAADREHLTVILRSGEHLLGLINDILSLARIEAGRLTLNEATFDLPDLLRGLSDMFVLRAKSKGVSLVTELGAELPHAVRGDEGKLRQMLINLLGNAVKFTERGRVTLRARWQDGLATFEVEDTGVGIAPDELAALFSPFVQAAAGAAQHEGTGLGLSLSRSFARLMGGDVEATSTPGRGSSFRVVVPLAEADPGDVVHERRALRAAPGQPVRRILVADDVEENRSLLVQLLGGLGLEVREARDGEEALRAWEADRFEMILLDMRMPGLDGAAVTRAVRAREQGGDRRTAIVAVTASAFSHEREEILRSGCDGFVSKPFRIDAIVGAVERYLGVRFEYDEPDEPMALGPALGADRLSALPRELREELWSALEKGDDQKALAAVARVAEHDGELASALRARIRGVRFDELQGMLEETRG